MAKPTDVSSSNDTLSSSSSHINENEFLLTQAVSTEALPSPRKGRRRTLTPEARREQTRLATARYRARKRERSARTDALSRLKAQVVATTTAIDTSPRPQRGGDPDASGRRLEREIRSLERAEGLRALDRTSFPGTTLVLYRRLATGDLALGRHGRLGSGLLELPPASTTEIWEAWRTGTLIPPPLRDLPSYLDEAARLIEAPENSRAGLYQGSLAAGELGFLLAIGLCRAYGRHHIPRSALHIAGTTTKRLRNPTLTPTRWRESAGALVRAQTKRFRGGDAVKASSFHAYANLIHKLLRAAKSTFHGTPGLFAWLDLEVYRNLQDEVATQKRLSDTLDSWECLSLRDMDALLSVAEELGPDVANQMVFAASLATRPSETDRFGPESFTNGIVRYSTSSPTEARKITKTEDENSARRIKNPKASLVTQLLAGEPRRRTLRREIFDHRAELFPPALAHAGVDTRECTHMKPPFSKIVERTFRTTCATHLMFLFLNREKVKVSLTPDEIAYRMAHKGTNMLNAHYTNFNKEHMEGVHPLEYFGFEGGGYLLKPADGGEAIDVTALDNLWDAWLLRKLLRTRRKKDPAEFERLKEKVVGLARAEMARRNFKVTREVDED